MIYNLSGIIEIDYKFMVILICGRLGSSSICLECLAARFELGVYFYFCGKLRTLRSKELRISGWLWLDLEYKISIFKIWHKVIDVTNNQVKLYWKLSIVWNISEDTRKKKM